MSILSRTSAFLRRPAPEAVLPILAGTAFAATFLHGFWLGDDSFITFRTLDNFLHGYGLRWNVAERVQSFTNPLWLFAMVPFYALLGNIYYAALVTSAACAAGTVFLIMRNTRSHFKLLVTVCTFMLTKSFMEYTSSGLENVLSYLLITAYFFRYREVLRLNADTRLTKGTGLQLSLLFALLVLNRMDLSLLLVLPHAYAGWVHIRQAKADGIRPVLLYLLGLTPILFWLAFSLVYYGFPFPNTYYAKTTLPIETVRYPWVTGYYHYALSLDPLVLAIPLLAIVVALMPGRRLYLLFAAGIVLENLYIIKIGGDFMGGRWLTPPFLLGLLMLADMLPLTHLQQFAWKHIAAGLVLLLSAFYLADAMLRYNPFSHGSVSNVFLFSGTVDERLGWGAFTRLKGCVTGTLCYQHLPVYHEGAALQTGGVEVAKAESIGILGFTAGPSVKIIDAQALSDPLLARMICEPKAPGHCTRAIPAGYDEPGQMPQDPQVAEYHKGLKIITQGDLFSMERLAAIREYNLGPRKTYRSYQQSLGLIP